VLCFSDDLAVIAYRPGASRSAAVGPIRVTPARHAGGADADGPLTRAVAAAQHGDEAAFTQVYRAVQPGLLRYLTVLVGADAEDVASETWAQVCRDFSGFKGDADGFRAWTATIGRHRAMDHLRARARRPVAVTTLDELMAWPARDDTAGGALEALSTPPDGSWANGPERCEPPPTADCGGSPSSTSRPPSIGRVTHRARSTLRR
jgi:RNA polymerase sigma-70 factor, ECF subfamily